VPVRRNDPPSCTDQCNSAVGIDYHLLASQGIRTVFRVSGDKDWYLNSSLGVLDQSRACGTSSRVSYRIDVNDRLAAHGTATREDWTQIRDLHVGRHAQVSFSAVLTAPAGCIVVLELADPAVDALKGWWE
jgi:hypothetical protein